jgi:hypothetical protein
MEFLSLAERTLFAQNAYGTRIYQELNPYLTKGSQLWQTDKLINRLRYRLGIINMTIIFSPIKIKHLYMIVQAL